MKSKIFVVLAAAVSLWIPSGPVAAHHGVAGYDMTKTITVHGTVSKFDWSNPHVRLYLEVKDASNTVTWEVDMGPPNQQIMNGWKIDTYRHGDRVSIEIYPAKDGSNVGYGKKVTALPRSE